MPIIFSRNNFDIINTDTPIAICKYNQELTIENSGKKRKIKSETVKTWKIKSKTVKGWLISSCKPFDEKYFLDISSFIKSSKCLGNKTFATANKTIHPTIIKVTQSKDSVDLSMYCTIYF